MRAIKLAIMIVIGLVLMMVFAANWTPVDLNLLPLGLGISGFTYPAVPLTLIIVAAVLLGFILAMLFEMIKSGQARERMNEKAREIARLRKENARLAAKHTDEDDDLQQLLAS